MKVGRRLKKEIASVSFELESLQVIRNRCLTMNGLVKNSVIYFLIEKTQQIHIEFYAS